MSHPSSSVQQARETLAARLLEIRLDAGITKRELAARCRWHESKSGRIENARTPPSDADIPAWCTACGTDNQAADLIAANRRTEAMYVKWRRLQRTGLRRLQESGTSLYQRTRHFRIYCSDVIPGVLQTPGYATALLTSIAAFRGTPDDVNQAVQARVRRNAVTRQGDHRFAILLEESVLRYRIGDPAPMTAQLGHLLSAMALPAVSLDVIPLTAQRTVWPMATFTVFDDTRVHADTLDAAATLTEPGQVTLHTRAFAALAENAVHGVAARTLLTHTLTGLDN
ncbi:helix-turn-helix domain-containing protein [Streptomyces spinosirectus]